jgi:hypothetical protein
VGQAERRAQFLATLTTNAGEADAEVARRIMVWADDRDLRETYLPANAQGGAFSPVIRGTRMDVSPFNIANVDPDVSVAGEGLQRQTPFNIAATYQGLLDRLYAIPQVVKTPKSVFPHISLTALADDEVWDRFFDVMGSVVDRVKRAAARGLS